MKVGTLTYDQAIVKLYTTHSILCDQIGEFVSISKQTDEAFNDEELLVYPISSDDMYVFTKSQNETVGVYVATNSNSSIQYMRFFTEDGDEMDFVLFEPAPIIAVDSQLHPA